MHNRLIIVVALAVVALMTGCSNGGNRFAELDQDNLYGTCCTIAVESPDVLVQTVRAGIDGTLDGILVEIHDPIGNGAMKFSVFAADSDGTDEPVFTEAVDSTTIFDGSPDGVEFVWDVSPAAIELRTGDLFAFGLAGTGDGNGAHIANDVAAQYIAGELTINGTPPTDPQDLAFRTYVLR